MRYDHEAGVSTRVVRNITIWNTHQHASCVINDWATCTQEISSSHLLSMYLLRPEPGSLPNTALARLSGDFALWNCINESLDDEWRRGAPLERHAALGGSLTLVSNLDMGGVWWPRP